MDKKNIFRLSILIAVIVLAAFVHSWRHQEFTQMEIALDTVIEIKVTAPNKIALQDVVNEAFEIIQMYEKKFSYYDEESELYKMNQSEVEQIEIDADWYAFLSLAKEVFVETDSLYDISIGNLSELWDFDKETIPSQEEIQTAQKNIGFENIHFSKEDLFLPNHYKINLGSIAKGFIIDKVVKFLQENGVTSGIINAGGDIKMFGQKKPIKVGIKHPRQESMETIDVLHLQNVSVVTTGDYERYFIKDGIRYHHIINPRTGTPANTMISITVIHPSSFIADAYSTGLFLLSPQNAIQIANSKQDIDVVLYYEEDNKIKKLQSNGMKQYEQ